MTESNEHLQHQTEGEVTANEEYQQLRDTVREMTGGLVIEGTDSPEAMAVSMFQPSATSGVVVTLAGRGIRTAEGGTEHSTDDVVVEDYTQPVPGAELKADQRAFNKRADAFRELHPDYDEWINQDIELPVAVHRVILQATNGPELAYALAHTPEAVERLCELAQTDVTAAVHLARLFAKNLERSSLDANKNFSEYRAARNRDEQIRRRPRNG